MRKYVLSRFLQLIIVILAATFITFGLTYISPSDPAELRLLSRDIIPTEELLTKMRAEMGLDKPFLVQYGNWLVNLLGGDLGESFVHRKPVTEVMAQKIPETLKLASFAFVLFMFSSLGLGILAAVRKNKIIDHLIRSLTCISISIPSFWLGLILMYVFAVKLKLLSITDTGSFKSLILPSITLAVPLIGKYTRLIRAVILEQLSMDYVIGAYARGFKESKVILRYVLPNSLIAIIPLIGLSTATLLGGTVIVENIFSWPGLGAMALEAITYRDYPLLQAYVIFMAITYVLINFIVDIFVQAIDPRISIRGDDIR